MAPTSSTAAPGATGSAATAATTSSAAGPERDDVEGGLGDDELDGGRGGFDTLTGGIGSDRIDGGPGGHDIASYRSAGGPIEVDLASGAVSGAEEERLVGVEDVVGGFGDDLLITSEVTANRVEGGPGDDRLLGSWSEDEAFGGPGSDECFGSFSVAESCGAASGVGTRVELYDSLTGAATLAIAGDAGVDEISVGFRQGRFLVRSEAGNPVRLGDPRYAGGLRVRRPRGLLRRPTSTRSSSPSVPANDLVDLERSLPPGVAVTVDGGSGSDWLLGGRGGDTLYAGDDADPDRLEGGGGDDALFGVNILHPRRASGAATMLGGGGDDLLIGGQPCEGDLFVGGPGANDSASFARVRNEGVHVEARIGGEVVDPEAAACTPGRIARSTEKIEGSTGPDRLDRLRRRRHPARPRRRRPPRRPRRSGPLHRRPRRRPRPALRVPAQLRLQPASAWRARAFSPAYGLVEGRRVCRLSSFQLWRNRPRKRAGAGSRRFWRWALPCSPPARWRSRPRPRSRTRRSWKRSKRRSAPSKNAKAC